MGSKFKNSDQPKRERQIDYKRMRVYTLEDDWLVVVGKTDADNDFISLRFSHGRDYWFHVDNLPGSHVLLLFQEDKEPSRAILEQAAAIAAWHSKGKKASRIGVSMTMASKVGKRKGAPAGQVTVKGEKVLRVKPGLPD
jgi:predicted ribosome quality control (RQC) complex YloA/Tae2 family protein